MSDTEKLVVGCIGLVLTFVAAVYAYWLRNNHRWLYGLSEILIGILLMYLAWFPHTNFLLLNGGGLIDTLLTKPVQIFAGIYAFVRGCDNWVTGLRGS